MEQSNKFDLISVAYRSRFVFRSDAEYREAMGASFETVTAKRDSERDQKVYYSSLARAVKEMSPDIPLDAMIEAYLEASDLCLNMDWGDRTQMASRKKFCRMLFRLCATAGRPLTADEVFKFKAKESDKDLLDIFFPRGMKAAPVQAIAFTVLFAFGIVRPWSTENSRARDVRDEETVGLLEKLADLISLLRDDTPRLGSTEKPMAFEQWIEIINGYRGEPQERTDCTPVMFLTAVVELIKACRSLVVSGEQRVTVEKFSGLYMHGIWVDDTDEDRNRFWIFPDNLLAAFCYRRDGVGWVVEPYDFRVKKAENDSRMDAFALTYPQGNLNYTLSPDSINIDDHICCGCYEDFTDEETGEISRLELTDGALPLPEWVDWREWRRLADDDPRANEFRTVLNEVYDPWNPQSMIFRNVAPEITDSVNNLVGRDNKYLYIYDWHPGRFVMREVRQNVFLYMSESPDLATDLSLYELNISEENPLYAIPMKMKKGNPNPDLDRLAEIMTDADNINGLSIIHSKHVRLPRLLFPTYGFSIGLDMEQLQTVGIKKFTRRPL